MSKPPTTPAGAMPPQFHRAWLRPEGEGTVDSRKPFIPHGTPGLPDPWVHDNTEAALRLREMNHAAKRLADMTLVSGLAWSDAIGRLRLRGIPPASPLDAFLDSAPRRAALEAALARGDISFSLDATSRSVRANWTDAAFGPPVIGGAAAPEGWGGIVTGTSTPASVTSSPIRRAAPQAGKPWPLGDDVAAPAAPDAALARAVAHFMAASPGVYGLLIASPERVLFERYGAGGSPDRVTPSWSMNKSMTGSLIGRMLQLGWLSDVYARAPVPAWRDPRGIHALITLDDLLRMRSGLALPCFDGSGETHIGFEGSSVYMDAIDCFAAAQANIVATRPGAVFRYINAGINALGAILRDRIEVRGLPYHQTLYGLLPDLLGMASYRMSGDIAGNLVASGSAFATLRDWAKLAVLYLQDGVWNGERLLPEGWVQYALDACHAGTSYAATFWTNADRKFPALPPDAAWLSGASDQRVFILRGAQRVLAVSNESDHPMDLAALNDVLGCVIATS